MKRLILDVYASINALTLLLSPSSVRPPPPVNIRLARTSVPPPACPAHPAFLEIVVWRVCVCVCVCVGVCVCWGVNLGPRRGEGWRQWPRKWCILWESRRQQGRGLLLQGAAMWSIMFIKSNDGGPGVFLLWYITAAGERLFLFPKRLKTCFKNLWKARYATATWLAGSKKTRRSREQRLI